MAAPVTPTKRVLTEEAHNAFNSSRSPYSYTVSEDLTACLQNLGSRVRKSVNEGYATQRYGGIPSVTPTPFSSPVKAHSASMPLHDPPIFRSANDTLRDIFSSPMRTADIAYSASPSPSPRKRGHSEVDEQEHYEEHSPITTIKTQSRVSAATEMEATSDDEDVVIITDMTPRRLIRPLRRTASAPLPPSPPFTASSCTSKSGFDPSNTVPPLGDAASASSTERKNILNRPF